MKPLLVPLLSAALLAFAACETEKTKTPETGTNRLTADERTIELRSAFSKTESDWEYGKMWGVALFTQEYSSIPETEPHTAVYLILSEGLLGKEIDLTEPLGNRTDLIEIEIYIDGKEYDLYREGSELEIWYGDNEVHGSVEITSGRMKVAYGEGTVSVVVEIAFSDGKRLSAAWDGPFVGKSPSSGPETGTVYGTMQIDDLSSDLRSGLYASVDQPDFGQSAFLLLTPQSELTITDMEVDFDPSTALMVQLPLPLLGRTIDLSQPLPAGTFDRNVYPETTLILCIDRCELELQAETDGWIAVDDNGEIPSTRTVTEGTFEVARTEDGNTLRLNAVLSDGARIAAEWDGPVEDVSDIVWPSTSVSPASCEARRSLAPDADARRGERSLRTKVFR